MPTYPVFGGLLDSEIAFDGLHAARGAPATWTFRVDRSGEAPAAVAEIGSEQVSAELTITLSRSAAGGMVLRYSAYGLGEFHISPDGAEIRWYPGPDPWHEALRWVLLGRVMATAMYVGGTICLHGSAVSLGGDGICFLAPKFHGKSTLAAALVAAGARLSSDDLVPIETGAPVRMRPGVPVLRLLEDSADAVALADRGHGRAADDVGKARIDFSAADDLVAAAQALSAIYILAPAREEPAPGRAVVRERLEGARALEAVVRHSSIAPLLSAGESRLLLTQAAAVVRSVPVYVLRPVRRLERLPEVVAALQEWHGAVRRPEPTAAMLTSVG